MINYSRIPVTSVLGRLLRLPLRLLPRDMVVRIKQGPLRGKKWIVGASNHGCWLGSYEQDKQLAFAAHVSQGEVLFDVGAHVGFYTLLGSALVGDEGHVFAFEPLPRNLDHLTRHLELNGIHNTTVVRAAVSDKPGAAKFLAGPTPMMGMLASEGELDVELVSLDDLYRQQKIPLPDCIKIDVEGAEAGVLKGAETILREGAPSVFLATHGKEVHKQCLEILHSFGYQCDALDGVDETACTELLARRPSEPATT